MLIPFSVWGKLKFLHYIQCIKLATRSCLWRYSVLTIVGHTNTVWSTVFPLCMHGLQLGSVPLLSILDWCAHVDILWYWAASIKSPDFPFKFELPSHCWGVALSASALSVRKGHFPCSGFSLHHFFMSSNLTFLAFLYIFSCFCWFSIDVNFFLSRIKLIIELPGLFYHWVKFLRLFFL